MNKKHVWALAAITVLTLTACGKGSSAKPEGGADKAAAKLLNMRTSTLCSKMKQLNIRRT